MSQTEMYLCDGIQVRVPLCQGVCCSGHMEIHYSMICVAKQNRGLAFASADYAQGLSTLAEMSQTEMLVLVRLCQCLCDGIQAQVPRCQGACCTRHLELPQSTVCLAKQDRGLALAMVLAGCAERLSIQAEMGQAEM